MTPLKSSFSEASIPKGRLSLGAGSLVLQVKTLHQAIVNGNFEKGDLTGWTVTSLFLSPPPAGIAKVESSVVYKGKYACELDFDWTYPYGAIITQMFSKAIPYDEITSFGLAAQGSDSYGNIGIQVFFDVGDSGVLEVECPNGSWTIIDILALGPSFPTSIVGHNITGIAIISNTHSWDVVDNNVVDAISLIYLA